MIFDKFRAKKKENFEIFSPVKGDVIDVTKTNDPLFKSEGLGEGVGIIAEENTLVSPVNGEIKTFFPTKHAIGITSDDGVDILIHVGIDTVELNGKYFNALKEQGDKVKKGDKLLEVDFDSIKNEGYDTTVLLVITNTQEYSTIKSCEGNKTVDDTIIEIQK
ncbi:PTS sugar transporter subunit IIA [Catenibacterium mitsuokai]|uniref:PTS sugar transporter subunit IIA n=1 Tax=Catenibacterium mitsuokai TaxID=100886 RepID=UPI003F93539C